MAAPSALGFFSFFCFFGLSFASTAAACPNSVMAGESPDEPELAVVGEPPAAAVDAGCRIRGLCSRLGLPPGTGAEAVEPGEVAEAAAASNFASCSGVACANSTAFVGAESDDPPVDEAGLSLESEAVAAGAGAGASADALVAGSVEAAAGLAVSSDFLASTGADEAGAGAGAGAGVGAGACAGAGAADSVAGAGVDAVVEATGSGALSAFTAGSAVAAGFASADILFSAVVNTIFLR